LLALSDTVAVMHRGRLAGVLPRGEAVKERVLDLAFGAGIEPEVAAQAKPRRRLAVGRELGLALFLLLMCAALGVTSDQFLTVQNLTEKSVEWSHVVIAAMGMTMIILTAGIDISVGSTLAVCAITAGLLVTTAGWPLVWVVLAVLGSGLALGTVNGLGIAVLGLPAIIMTLATLKIYRGLVFQLPSKGWVTGIPESFRWLAEGQVGPLPFPVLAAVLSVAMCVLVLRYTTFGRSLYAIGNNASAAANLGIRLRLTRWLVYTLGGGLVGLSALVFAPQYRNIQTNTGELFELVVITAVVVGGTKIFGGRGTALGTVLGVALLAVIDSALNLLGTSGSDYWERCFHGALVLLAVMTDFLGARARRARGTDG
jgi:ribose/xylose/arabinose/galactoside ABC-type transport system permease subunit